MFRGQNKRGNRAKSPKIRILRIIVLIGIVLSAKKYLQLYEAGKTFLNYRDRLSSKVRSTMWNTG